ncbi:MAG: PDZ domain-containing protein [Planctomycetales bacterium]|nr:PDZ domain-containing protein [Planctomycetales bacterium]MBN8625053.1 PDZ domain-containing protein [Planctomycetota bacterium]
MIHRLSQVRLIVGMLAISFVASSATSAVAATDDLSLREESAFRSVVAAVAPAVVSIETIGGLDTVGEMLVGTGPSSGLVVSADGYIVSSTVNFAHRPASIIVTMAGNRRLPAKLVARDEVRKLVLLKVEASGLPIPAACPQSEIAVGQWSIAVGRTFDSDRVNSSVGVVSAVNRIWGKALQTDAKISPVNYGGPLVDIRGRVLGILVPLSPTESEDESGAEWYDSGIGFAVPLEHVFAVLPRWKKGDDLKAGFLGIRFKGPNIYADAPILAHARANSPAYKAGLRKGDVLRKVDGREVEIQTQVMEAIQSRYAGDVIRLSASRINAETGKLELLDKELTLVDKLEPYKRPYLGFLPVREDGTDDGKKSVGVRYVFEKSPAAEAKLQAGDRITAVGDIAVSDRRQLALAVAESEPAKPVVLHVRRGDEKLRLEVKPAARPETVPEKLGEEPKSTNDDETAALEKPRKLQIAEFGNECSVYLPRNYTDDVAHGLVILLHPSGGFGAGELRTRLEAWLPVCRRDRLILLVPTAKDDEGTWGREDLEFLGKAVDRTAEEYRLDATRVVAVGWEEGGSLAMRAAAAYPERIRAAALVNAMLVGPLPDSEPQTPLAYYIAVEKSLPEAGRIKAGLKQLRDRDLPVTFRELPAGSDDLPAAQLGELARWIDMLDRI